MSPHLPLRVMGTVEVVLVTKNQRLVIVALTASDPPLDRLSGS